MADLVKSLAEIFSNKIFCIPDYQRGYAWEKQQWDDFILDLELLPENKNHFFGTLTIKSTGVKKMMDEEGRAYISFDIIDGQQRLTTAIIFLQAIHDELLKVKEYKQLANGLKEMYLANLDLNQQPFTKLKLNPDCHEFFEEAVLGFSRDVQGPKIRSHQLLQGSFFHFRNYLKMQQERLKGEYLNWLQNLYFKITQQLTMIVYEVDDIQEAGIIFETMNDRGRSLSELDKVKNYLLYISSKLDLPSDSGLVERINSTWSHIFKELMSAGLSSTNYEDQLLRAHWLTIYNPDATLWKQSRSIKDQFNLKTCVGKHNELLQDLREYLETLRNVATAYSDLYRPERSNAYNDITDTKLREQIIFFSTKLSRLGSRAGFHPILLAARLKGADGGKTYLEIVKLCEAFEFRAYRLMEHSSRKGQSRLFHLGFDFFHDRNFGKLKNGILDTLLDLCSDKDFIQDLQEDRDYYHWDGIKYFLYEYEQFLAEQAGKKIEMPWEVLIETDKKDTIEHILPQTPVDKYWTSRFSEDEQNTWTNDIGNLTLTYDNSPMLNKPFRKGKKAKDDKLYYYKESNLFTEKEVSKFDEWNVESIQSRRNRIVNWAIKRWNVETPPAILTLPIISVSDMGKIERRNIYRKRFLNKAKANGNYEEFLALLEVLERFPLYCYLNPKYQGISFTLLNKRTTWVMWLGPDLYFSVETSRLAKLIGVSRDTIEENLEINSKRVPKDRVEDLIACLENILSMIKK
jgi:hypothetical protein